MRLLKAWGPPALWLALMVAATSIPNLDTSQWSNGDKVFHLVVYAVLAILSVRALALSARLTAAVWAVLAVSGVAVGAADELHEMLIPGRTVSLADFILNATGFAIGLYLGYLRFARAKTEAVL